MSKKQQVIDNQKTHKININKKNREKPQQNRLLKERFLAAVASGALGQLDHRGRVVTLKEFKAYFSDITTDYINSFLPAATIETGRTSCSHTRFVFRLSKGVYLLHPDVLDEFLKD